MENSIILQLCAIDKNDLTHAELRIAKILIDYGHAKWHHETDEGKRLGIFLEKT